MPGRSDGHGLTWLRGALVIVVIAAVLGVFGGTGALKRPQLGALQIVGLAVMVLALAAVLLTRRLAAKLPEARRERAALAFSLGGVTVCAVGALLVFM